MPEEPREVIRQITDGGITLTDLRLLVWTVMSLALGMLARTLIDPAPIDWKRLGGELILAVIGGVTLFAFGVMQDLSGWEVVALGGLAGLGGVRVIEYLLAFAKQMPGRDK